MTGGLRTSTISPAFTIREGFICAPATLTCHPAGGVIAYGKLITYGIYREYPDQKTGSVEDYVALDLRTGKWIYTHLDYEVMEYVSLEDL